MNAVFWSMVETCRVHLPDVICYSCGPPYPRASNAGSTAVLLERHWNMVRLPGRTRKHGLSLSPPISGQVPGLHTITEAGGLESIEMHAEGSARFVFLAPHVKT